MLDASHNTGLVSIIIPAHNAEKWIEKCVWSAINQTYKHIEVIVVENGSVDATADLVASIDDNRVRLFSSEIGVSNARNKGLDEAKGEYVTFLDADDWLERTAIEKMISVLHEDVDIVSARYFDDVPFEKYKSQKYDAGNEEYLLKCLYTPTKRGNITGNLYRKAFLEKTGIRFNPGLSHAEDSVFFIGLLLKGPIIIDLEEPVYHVYVNPNSATRGKTNGCGYNFSDAIQEIYSMTRGMSSEIVNGGYVFALNQLLVVLVHSTRTIKEIKKVCNQAVFEEAIEKASLTTVEFAKRTIFWMIKNKMYMFLQCAIAIRRIVNNMKAINT